MATLQRLEQALINADKAGDTSAAKVFAEEIRKRKAATVPPPVVPKTAELAIFKPMPVIVVLTNNNTNPVTAIRVPTK